MTWSLHTRRLTRVRADAAQRPTAALTGGDSPLNLLVEHWTYRAPRQTRIAVLPDGCCDVIVRQEPSKPPDVIFAEPTDGPALVHSAAGTRYRGLRLLPGASPRMKDINALLVRNDFDLDAVATHLSELVHADPDTVVALELLGRAAGHVGPVARQLGVAERTLRRRLVATTGWPPKYWQALARIRRTARKLLDGHAIAEIAHEEHFADQAHLTREMRRWFSVTPTGFRDRVRRGQLSLDSGYF